MADRSNLSAKQQRFCDEYLVCLNATKAAINAGYSKKYAGQNADKLLKNTKIKEFISKRMAEKEAELIADQNEVLKYLTSVLRGESKSSVIVIESVGDFMTQAREVLKSPDEKERLKAAELLGKTYKIFNGVEETDSKPTIIIDL